MIQNASIGVVLAIIYAGIGYASAKAKSQETFEPVKFAKTIAIGFIVGAFASALNMPPETLENVSFIGFITVFVDKVTGLLMPKKV